MDKILALVDYIENIKEKITDKEYKDISELLANIKAEMFIKTVLVSNQVLDTRSDSLSDSDSVNSEQERRERQLYEKRINRTIPDVQIKIFDGNEITEKNARYVWLNRDGYGPQGFALPSKISSQLAAFFGVPEDTFITRPNVLKTLTKYIREHNLQNPNNKRIIDLDKPGGEPLRTLLNVPSDEVLTFFNIQRYLNIHYIPWPERTNV